MIAFIGDAHGKIKGTFGLLDRIGKAEPAPTYQLGDMGLGFTGVELPPQRSTFRFIRGNHDDPAACQAHPNYLGEYGLTEVAGRRMFYIGGAWSIDSAWRKAKMDSGSSPLWWPDEELSQESLDAAVKLYIESKPDLVMSHECPQEVGRVMLGALIIHTRDYKADYYSAKLDCCNSRTSVALQTMLTAHAPRDWVFGHYHVDQHVTLPDCLTNFRCVAELSTYIVDQEKAATT